MEKIYSYYQKNVQLQTENVHRLQKKIHLLGTLRLILVAILIAAIWFFKSAAWSLLAGITLFVAILFILLLVGHNRIYAQKRYAEALAKLCQQELNGLDYDFSAFDGAPEKSNAEHPFSLDLDLFGSHSLFQSINRTVTALGKERLADWFIHPLTDSEQIRKRQTAIGELAPCIQFRQHFYVTGILQPREGDDPSKLTKISQNHTTLSHSRFWKTALILHPTLWILLTLSALLGITPFSLLGLLFSGSFLLAYATSKQVNTIHHASDQLEQILLTDAKLIHCIENSSFQSAALTTLRETLSNNGTTASWAIRRLSQLIGSLNQRYSIMGVLLNLFTLRDTRKAIQLEQWKELYGNEIPRWQESLAQFDAYCSLAGFAYNHPNYIYPEITSHYFQMEGEGVGHPLIHRNRCVRNDITIHKNPWFLIITGANMAGKSTYLRTVGVNYLLGCIGAPVCAHSLKLYPAQLVTSLRTTDSLSSHESYFFAELKRLKMIIDRLQQGEQLFIILDEILKGTNSIDKQKGSLALMKQLIKQQACGIIATHDLVLGTLEQEFPDQIKNYRFEADIHNNELTFSYLLREGVAQNMNACFLMKKMGITL